MESIEKTQFVYKRELVVNPIYEDKVGDEENKVIKEEGYTKIVLDSFNMDCVIRSITTDDGKLLVLLDDLHERYETKPKVHPKTGTPKFDRKGAMIFERIKETFQSEIYLSKEEGEQFYKLTAANNYEK